MLLNNDEKDKRNKGMFMKIIIIYCLVFMAVTNVYALIILQLTGYNASNIINSINAVHGGELLFCCMKKIIDSPNNDIGQKIKKKNRKSEGTKNE